MEGVPQSCVGAPSPFILSDEHVLLLAYLVEQGPIEWEEGRVIHDADLPLLRPHFALIEFKRCYSYMFGWPNDEALNGHPLYERGLRAYSAFEVKESSWIRQLERMNSVHPVHNPERFSVLNHYVFTFHDSMFECVAQGIVISQHDQSPPELLLEMQRRIPTQVD